MKRILPALLGVLILSVGQSALGQREPTEEEKERTRIRLGISREQQSQIEAVFSDAKRQEGDIHTKTKEQYGLLFTLYESYEFDRELAKKIRREISRLSYRRMLVHADTQEKLRKVLTREQFDKMTQHGREMREKWRREGPPRRGPGGFRH